MSRERDFVERLRTIAHDPAARGLLDDTAVLPTLAGALVLTHDMLLEGVHYLPDDAPADVAWKLVAVNLSDLAGKGAKPRGVLLGYMLGEPGWDVAFVDGLREVLARFDVPLLGGDTVRAAGPRALGLTAIGRAPACGAPSRTGARVGDGLWVTGTIGAAGRGLMLAQAGQTKPAAWLAAYRRPMPRLAEGRALAGRVHAMADVSDGLLIDAARMAAASGLTVTVALDRMPLAQDIADTRADRLAAASAGDDYELLFAAPADFAPPPDVACTKIGDFAEGAGLRLRDGVEELALPPRLGFEH